MLIKRQFMPQSNIDKHQDEKSMGACTRYSKLTGAAAPVAPVLTEGLDGQFGSIL